MKRLFAVLLRRCREEAGFPTELSFVRAHGAAHLGCTERAYRDLERGRALPSPRLMSRLATALRLGLREEAARELMRAYLRALLEDDEFIAFLSEALATPPARRERRGAEPADGKLLLEHPLLLRASEAELTGYWPFLTASLERFARNARARGARYSVEVSITPLRRF